MILSAIYVFLIMFIVSYCSTENDTCLCIPPEHLNAASIIWRYLTVRDPLIKSDVILGLGSHDRRVAMEAARLWLEGYGTILVFSGKSGNLTRDKWTKSEAEIFRDEAISMGIPINRIMVETQSRNTGENIRFTYNMLQSNNMIPKSLIIVQKPHMGLRTVATFEKQWPGNLKEVTWMVTSQQVSLLQYPNDDVGDLQNVISIMIGYLQRIKVYGTTGYQSYKYIPTNVWEAFKILKKCGVYSSHLLK